MKLKQFKAKKRLQQQYDISYKQKS